MQPSTWFCLTPKQESWRMNFFYDFLFTARTRLNITQLINHTSIEERYYITILYKSTCKQNTNKFTHRCASYATHSSSVGHIVQMIVSEQLIRDLLYPRRWKKRAHSHMLAVSMSGTTVKSILSVTWFWVSLIRWASVRYSMAKPHVSSIAQVSFSRNFS